MSSSILPTGFRAAGVTCGIKESGRPDLALFVSDNDAVAAGVFTTNRVVGAPVIVDRERVPSAEVRAVVVNSGNANACTGERGLENARKMTASVAKCLGCKPDQVLVCSTGIIGVQLPMAKIDAGIPQACNRLTADASALSRAAEAMMTTDTFAKSISVRVKLSTGTVRIAGAAKGAAMIAPNMATMLCVMMTDAVVTTEHARQLLCAAVDRSFNRISVDGHQSTSDSVLFLANGAAECSVQTPEDLAAMQDAVDRVCEKLATDIIRDAEGADHFVVIDVSGFSSTETACRVAKEVAESALVKTAIAGNDPNWGRITSAAGYAGVPFDTDFLSLQINGVEVFRAGTPVEFDEAALSSDMKNGDVRLRLELSGGPESGDAEVRFWTSDLTQEYVRLNSEYTT